MSATPSVSAHPATRPNRFARSTWTWWRHLWLDRKDIDRALDRAALQRLETTIAQSERRHSGEIRLCIEAALPWRYLRQGASPNTRALAMFSKLRVWDTEHNNGVLIYLLLADRAIEIVADRAVYRQLSALQWQGLVDGMTPLLQAQQYEAAIQGVIDALGPVLGQAFPVAADQPNLDELPNSADVR